MQSTRVISYEGVFFLLEVSQLLFCANPTELGYLYSNFCGSEIPNKTCKFTQFPFQIRILYKNYSTHNNFILNIYEAIILCINLIHILFFQLDSNSLEKLLHFLFFGALPKPWFLPDKITCGLYVCKHGIYTYVFVFMYVI